MAKKYSEVLQKKREEAAGEAVKAYVLYQINKGKLLDYYTNMLLSNRQAPKRLKKIQEDLRKSAEVCAEKIPKDLVYKLELEEMR